MKKLYVFLVSIFCFLISVSNIHAWGPEDESWQRQQKEYRQQTKQAKRISVAKAYAVFKSGKALLISVDPPGYYKRQHILGSINIPSEKFKKAKLKVPKSKIILLYCR